MEDPFRLVRDRGLKLVSVATFYMVNVESVWTFQVGSQEPFEVSAATEFQAWAKAIAVIADDEIELTPKL